MEVQSGGDDYTGEGGKGQWGTSMKKSGCCSRKSNSKRSHDDSFRFHRHLQPIHQINRHREESYIGEDVKDADEQPTGKLLTVQADVLMKTLELGSAYIALTLYSHV